MNGNFGGPSWMGQGRMPQAPQGQAPMQTQMAPGQGRNMGQQQPPMGQMGMNPFQQAVQSRVPPQYAYQNASFAPQGPQVQNWMGQQPAPPPPPPQPVQNPNAMNGAPPTLFGMPPQQARPYQAPNPIPGPQMGSGMVRPPPGMNAPMPPPQGIVGAAPMMQRPPPGQPNGPQYGRY
jgi:hypothetical protein